jgi:hypothetical protein
MEDQNMPRTDVEENDRNESSAQAGPAREAREDDRNDEIPESPAPDPEEGTRPGGEDDPQAD